MNQVLVVDDEAPMRTALEASFRKDGWNVTTAYCAKDAVAKFRQKPCSLVITDMRMPDGDGLDVLRGIRQMAPEVGVIFLTAFATVPDAVRAIQEGACDYLVKPVAFPQLKESAERVIHGKSSPVKQGAENPFAGKSLLLRNLLDRARLAAKTDTDVLIEAESGTGKELLARFIHRASGRAQRPFIAVNCAAFPDALLESELFGHARGAFTGALASKPGKFELAHTGTMLLDEIGEMPLILQPKLLRALQEREVDRLGDTKPIRIDVRVIATTNQPLLQLVEQGKFRADLYYRLNVVPLTLPPLRKRIEDIPILVDCFMDRFGSESRVSRPRFSPELLARLMLHDWPGNVRELENFVRRTIALHPGEVVGPEIFDEEKVLLRANSQGQLTGLAPSEGASLREMERKLLESTLAAHGGNRTRAARALGICPRTMRNKVREYGLPPRRPS